MHTLNLLAFKSNTNITTQNEDMLNVFFSKNISHLRYQHFQYRKIKDSLPSIVDSGLGLCTEQCIFSIMYQLNM